MKLWSCKVLIHAKKNKLMELVHNSRNDHPAYNPSKFKSDYSREKEDTKCHFFGVTRKINFIYLLWKLKIPKTAFNSKTLLVQKTFRRKENLNLRKHCCQKGIKQTFAKLFFSLWSRKDFNSNAGKSSLVIVWNS